MRLFPSNQHEGSGGTAPRRGLLPFPRPAPAGAGAGRDDAAYAASDHALRASRRSYGDLVFKGLTIGFAMLVVVLVFAIVIALVYESGPAWAQIGIAAFFGGDTWLIGGEHPQFSALPLILGTLVTAAIALLIGVPVSIGIAIFLSELAPPWLRAPISIIVELLAAIPSVVYGLWGLYFLVPFLRDTLYPRLQANWGWTGLFTGSATGQSVLTAGILLSIMIIPTVSSISREVFRAVPVSQREAAAALGATRWEVIRKAVIPYGRTGLFGGAILGLARALGETMAVVMVIGNRTAIFSSLLSPGSTIPATLANQINEAHGIEIPALFALAVILFVVSLGVNIVARLMVRKMAKRGGSSQ